MNRFARHALPITLTTLAVIAAAFMLHHLWHYYMDEPWTRDAHVNADIVQVSPDVSGLVIEVKARDNDTVTRGQPLPLAGGRTEPGRQPHQTGGGALHVR